MSNLTINIIVGPVDLKVIRDSGLNLCVTRHVRYNHEEVQGNAVLSLVRPQQLAPNVQFNFEERYQTFGTSSFMVGSQVQADTEKVSVEEGQEVTLTSVGEAQLSGPPQPGQPFQVKNNWRNGGRIGLDNYDTTTGQFHTTFVSPATLMTSISSLAPLKKFSIWWEMRSETDIMIDVPSTSPFPFELDTNEITIEYQDGRWSIV